MKYHYPTPYDVALSDAWKRIEKLVVENAKAGNLAILTVENQPNSKLAAYNPTPYIN